MINQQFSEFISLLTDKLNKTNYGKDPGAFPLNRLRNSLSFIIEKQSHFSENLDDLIFELEDMKKDAEKLFKEFATRPESFQILEYVKKLIQSVRNEKISRKSIGNTTKIKKEKVKIFTAVFKAQAEEEINKFLEENNVEITRAIQSGIDRGGITITIFYKEI